MDQHDIPLRPQQLRCDLNDLKHLSSLRSRGIIRWRFTPFGLPTGLEPLSDDERDFYDVVRSHCAKKTQRLAPHLIAYLRTMGWNKPYLRSDFTKSCLGIGGTKVIMGRPLASAHELDWLTTSDLLLVPHVSRTGPNGIWHIERGELHPFMLAAASLQVWTLANSAGQPDFCFHLDRDDPVDSSSARGIDLFTSSAGAQDWIDQTWEVGDPVLSPMALNPRELLACLARADVAAIDRTDYAVSTRGRVALACSGTAGSGTLLQALGG